MPTLSTRDKCHRSYQPFLIHTHGFNCCHFHFINLQGKQFTGYYHTMKARIGALIIWILWVNNMQNRFILEWKTSMYASNSKFYDSLLLCLLTEEQGKEKKKARISPSPVNPLPLFWLGMPTLGDRHNLACHILATISTLLVEIVTDRVTHLGSTPVPRTIFRNTILALSKLQGFPCKVRNPRSWRFVYFAVSKGKGLLCESFARNFNV